MLQKLFSSKVRVSLLHTFFLHPDQPHYLRELERMTGEDYKNISSELLSFTENIDETWQAYRRRSSRILET